MKKTTTETTEHEVPTPYAIEKRITPSVILGLIFISLLFAMLCYAFLGTFKYRDDLRKEKGYKKIIIEDIVSQYAESTDISGFSFHESYGADDGYCRIVDVYLGLDSSETPQIDRWFCYIVVYTNGYYCDCDYIGTVYLEERI